MKNCPKCSATLSQVGLITAESIYVFYSWKYTKSKGVEYDKIDEESGDGVVAVLCGKCNEELALPTDPYSDEFLEALT